MKFRGLKPIVSETNAWREISESLRDLFQGLTKLSFVDNMESFEISNVSIGSGVALVFNNKLKSVPTRWIVVRNSTGMPISDDAFSGWNINQVSLKNVGASATIISVVFLR
jgi:hypothetical protein